MSFILESKYEDMVKTGFIYVNHKDGIYTNNINKATKFRSRKKAEEVKDVKEIIREYKNKKLI